VGGVGEDAGYACALCVLLENAIQVSVFRRTVLGPAPMRIAKPEGGIVRCMAGWCLEEFVIVSRLVQQL
jgi:hypothetical protein